MRRFDVIAELELKNILYDGSSIVKTDCLTSFATKKEAMEYIKENTTNILVLLRKNKFKVSVFTYNLGVTIAIYSKDEPSKIDLYIKESERYKSVEESVKYLTKFII